MENRKQDQSKKTDVYQQSLDYENQNPKVAEAMRLFGMTMETYQSALAVPQTYYSTTATPTIKK